MFDDLEDYELKEIKEELLEVYGNDASFESLYNQIRWVLWKRKEPCRPTCLKDNITNTYYDIDYFLKKTK